MPPPKNLSDHWFGRLYVIGPLETRDRWGQINWDCLCECGTATIVRSRDLTSHRTLSCGCLHRDITRTLFTTHGHSGKPEYKAWKAARGRCENPDDQAFPDYGGRGIEFRLPDFEIFLGALGPKPHTGRWELDRIDVHGHYEIGNVRWWPKGKGMRRPRRSSLTTR